MVVFSVRMGTQVLSFCQLSLKLVSLFLFCKTNSGFPLQVQPVHCILFSSDMEAVLAFLLLVRPAQITHHSRMLLTSVMSFPTLPICACVDVINQQYISQWWHHGLLLLLLLLGFAHSEASRVYFRALFSWCLKRLAKAQSFANFLTEGLLYVLEWEVHQFAWKIWNIHIHLIPKHHQSFALMIQNTEINTARASLFRALGWEIKLCSALENNPFQRNAF